MLRPLILSRGAKEVGRPSRLLHGTVDGGDENKAVSNSLQCERVAPLHDLTVVPLEK